MPPATPDDEHRVDLMLTQKGLTAPRIHPSDVDKVIVKAEYWRVPLTTTTVCALVLRNGHTVIGTSACVSTENFDVQVGRDLAYESARRQVWDLEGYLLRERLNAATQLATGAKPG